MIGATPGCVRGCGVRQEGGLYLESGLSPFGQPLEFFLADPPIPYEPDHKIGMELVERDGIWHVIDWVGEAHYRYPSDILEEVRAYGLSRRTPRNLDFSKLSDKSRILLVHAKACITNMDKLNFEQADRTYPELENLCWLYQFGRSDLHLKDKKLLCSRYHWTVHKEPVREFASIYYKTFPVGHKHTVEFQPGIIASFPITNFTVIRVKDGSHKTTIDKVRSLNPNLIVKEEDE